MIVIGIDPGTANTGFGVVRTSGERMVALDGGVIETPSDLSVEQRLTRSTVPGRRPAATALPIRSATDLATMKGAIRDE